MTWDIDTIVREVMRRMTAAPEIPAPVTAAAPEIPAPVTAADELRVTVPVVSLAALETGLARPESGSVDRPSQRPVDPGSLARRMQGIRRLTVCAGAVVTPAVRDLLKHRNIAIVEAGADRELPGAATAALVVGTIDATYDPTPLVAALAPRIQIERLEVAGLLPMVDALVNRVRSGGWLGLLVTDQSVAALCLANRQPGVRAAQVSHVVCVGKAADSVGANLLVVNPARMDSAQITQIADTFCQQGLRPCPQALRDRLGD